MLPWETVETAKMPDGGQLALARRGEEWVVRSNGRVLMSSLTHHSEDALAVFAFEQQPEVKSVLLGGLGLGFTLRAVLDRLPDSGSVVVAELSKALVQWNREKIADLAGRPLEDPRVQVVEGDVLKRLIDGKGRYHAILLDVDNGPTAFTQRGNGDLYTDIGVYSCLSALKGGGVLTVWSAGADPRYLDRLRSAGFDAKAVTVTARPTGGPRHVVFVAVKGKLARVR